MMPEISVIVPVYNTGEILKKTLDSILCQTFKDFELLLIDDGSTDSSGKVCDGYVKKDNRVRVFHKENGGICDARNFGLRYATGNYIAFCDHDDLFEQELLAKVYVVAKKNNADLVKFRYEEVDNKNRKRVCPLLLRSDKNMEFTGLTDSLYELNSLGCFTTIWSFLYNARWLKSTNILFNVKLKHGGEDYDFNLSLIPFVRKMIIMPDILYFHFVRTDLSTSAKMHEDVMHHFLKTQYTLDCVAEQIGCSPFKHKLAYIKYYGECVLCFLSGAIKLNKSKKSIAQELQHFQECNKIPTFRNLGTICKSFLVNPKETIFFLYCDLHLYSWTFLCNFYKCFIK